MDNVFAVRSAVALCAIITGSMLIGIGSSKEVACVAGGIAVLIYAFGVMLTLGGKKE